MNPDALDFGAFASETTRNSKNYQVDTVQFSSGLPAQVSSVFNCAPPGVIATDTITAFHMLTGPGSERKIGMVVFANPEKFLGGFGRHKAQEEWIAYMSDLIARKPNHYNLKPHQLAHVRAHIIRRMGDYGFVDPKEFTAIFCAAPIITGKHNANPAEQRRLRDEGLWMDAGPAQEAQIESQIEQMLRLAISQGLTTLLTGAWGSGIHNNEPNLVAKIFNKVYARDEFKGKIEVIFAIPGRPGDANLNAYEQLFGRAGK